MHDQRELNDDLEGPVEVQSSRLLIDEQELTVTELSHASVHLDQASMLTPAEKYCRFLEQVRELHISKK